MYLGILLQKDSVLLFSLAMPCLPHVTHFVPRDYRYSVPRTVSTVIQDFINITLLLLFCPGVTALSFGSYCMIVTHQP